MAQEPPPAAPAQPADAAVLEAAPVEPEESPAAGCASRDPDSGEQLSDVQAPSATAAVGDAADPATSPPQARCSQNAGDQQYRDPFAGAEPPGGNGEAGGGGNSAQTGSDTGEQPAATTEGEVEATQSDESATGPGSAADAGEEGLPKTGLGLGGLLALGLPLLAGGVALRRRVA